MLNEHQITQLRDEQLALRAQKSRDFSEAILQACESALAIKDFNRSSREHDYWWKQKDVA